MLNFLSNYKDAGVVGPKMLYPDYTIQGTARRFPTLMSFFFGRKSVLSKIFPNNKYLKQYVIADKQNSEHPYEVDWVSGGAMMTKREVIRKVGVLDERFFMYWEDADFCFRIKQKGWNIFCIPSATILHYEGESSKGNKLRLIINFHKSVYLFYRKHYIKANYTLMNILAIVGLTSRALVIYGNELFKTFPRYLKNTGRTEYENRDQR